jgi:hypothetical protein
MKFRVHNPTPTVRLGIAPGGFREFTYDEMAEVVDEVLELMREGSGGDTGLSDAEASALYDAAIATGQVAS